MYQVGYGMVMTEGQKRMSMVMTMFLVEKGGEERGSVCGVNVRI